MRVVQMTLEENLIKLVDKIAGQLHTSRSAFTRAALREAVEKYKRSRLEQKHRKGYEIHPEKGMEFSVWEEEQQWGDK